MTTITAQPISTGKQIRNKQLLFVLYLITIGILFPAFKTFTRVPAFWPGFALLVLYIFRSTSVILTTKSLRNIYLLFASIVIFSLIPYYDYYFSLRLEIYNRVFSYLVAALILELLIIKKDITLINKIGKFSLAIIVISAFLQILAETFFPNVTRSSAYRSLPFWIVTYSFGTVNAMPFVTGIVLAMTKSLSWRNLLIVAILSYSIITTGFFAAVAALGVMLVISALLRPSFKRRYFFIGFIVLGSIIFYNRFGVLDAMKVLPNATIQEKAAGVEQKIITGEGSSSIETRQQVYERSITSIIGNAILGAGKSDLVGGHSYWLDKLAQFGVLGTLPYILVLLSMYKSARRIIPPTGSFIYKILFSIVLLILLFNPYEDMIFWTIIFVFIPCIMNYLNSISNLSALPVKRKM